MFLFVFCLEVVLMMLFVCVEIGAFSGLFFFEFDSCLLLWFWYCVTCLIFLVGVMVGQAMVLFGIFVICEDIVAFTLLCGLLVGSFKLVLLRFVLDDCLLYIVVLLCA